MNDYHTSLQKYNSHFISLVRVETGVSERDRDRETETDRGLLYWPFLQSHVVSDSGLHLAILLLLGREVGVGGKPLGTNWPLSMTVSLWLRDWPYNVGTCVYIISQRPRIPVDNTMTRFLQSTHVSGFRPHIAVFLFSQLEHEGCVKGQYARLLFECRTLYDESECTQKII